MQVVVASVSLKRKREVNTWIKYLGRGGLFPSPTPFTGGMRLSWTRRFGREHDASSRLAFYLNSQ
jgi:hypothetical protein